jgi:archaellum component FlaC
LRVYNFEEFLNLIALKFQQTDDKIQDLEGKYEDLKKKYEIVSKQLEIIMKKNKEDVEIVL